MKGETNHAGHHDAKESLGQEHDTRVVECKCAQISVALDQYEGEIHEAFPSEHNA